MINSKECKEVFEFLSYMNKEDVMKIPEDILLYIKNKQDKEYNTKIKKETLFNLENISDNALNFLIYLDNTFLNQKDTFQTSIKDIIEKNKKKELEESNSYELIEYKKTNRVWNFLKNLIKLK